jgi:hypothetical protein
LFREDFCDKAAHRGRLPAVTVAHASVTAEAPRLRPRFPGRFQRRVRGFLRQPPSPVHGRMGNTQHGGSPAPRAGAWR